jgi:hypothetical protein
MKHDLHGMMVVAKKAISGLRRQFVLNILHLLTVASPAFVYISTGNEVFVGSIVTNHAFDIHQTMLAVLPNLCLSAVAVGTFLVHWHRGMLFLFCTDNNGDQEYKKKNHEPFHTAPLSEES